MRRTDAREAPIGVFDSGIGGLTVLAAIRRRLPEESTLYLGDTARVPYGPKSAGTIRRYAAEATGFLLERGVKAIVVACNTASAHALEVMGERARVPVIGVIGPGAEAAAEVSRTGRIGVIGTQGTIGSGAYERAIRSVRPEAEVISAACPLFVPLVEEGWTEGEVARLTAERYLTPLLRDGIDALVLGCTHYPLLRRLLTDVSGPEVALVDSAEATSRYLARRLETEKLRASGGGEARYFVTDDAPRFALLAERFLGAPIAHLEEVSVDSTA